MYYKAFRWWWIGAATLLLVVYGIGLTVDVMDVDAAQYASISMEMMQGGSYLQVMHHGNDYLDKPPLLFWTAALSYKLFGINNIAYKLPTLLFTLLGIFSTYGLARVFYRKRIALLAAFMLASCQAWFMFNNDVRTDAIMVGAMVFGVWQLAAYLHQRKFYMLLLGSIGIGVAMLAKGPIALMVPALAFGIDWLVKKQWRNFFRWEWIFSILMIGLVLSPMVIGLYQQFGSEGPYFFFWAQSFGRLTGDNPFINSQEVKQDPAPFYFVHTFLWSFLPWSLLTLTALMYDLINFFKKDKDKQFYRPEYLSIGGFILPIVALSFSEYKLPHYIYVTYPFAAILAAKFFDDMLSQASLSRMLKPVRITQTTLSILAWAAAGIIVFYLFGTAPIWLMVVLGLLLSVTIFLSVQKAHLKNIFFISLLSFIGLNLTINGHLMPQMLTYQSTNQVGRKVQQLDDGKPLLAYKIHAHSLDFYAQRLSSFQYGVYQLADTVAAGRSPIVYTHEEGLQDIKAAGIDYTIIERYRHYTVSLLRTGFLNPVTRERYLQKRYLLQL